MEMKADYVDGDGWISDESSFYGDDDVRTQLEMEAGRELKVPYFPFAHITAKRTGSILVSQPCPRADCTARPAAVVETTTTQVPSSRDVKDVSSGNKSIQVPDWRELAEFLQSDGLKEKSASWQHDEAIDAFLKRVPVADEKTAGVGAWLWVRNPEPMGSLRVPRSEDIQGFINEGNRLLNAFTEQKSKEDGDNFSNIKLTQRMRMRRSQLEEDLLAAAIRTGITSGKWMVFAGPGDLEKNWRIVAEATSMGRLGPASKVATYDASSDKNETLICVYTYDFSDLEDVQRVLNELKNCGLCAKDGKPIYYKCDAYTYLEIASGNAYNLRASVFSSKEVFENNPRVRESGPAAKAKRRNHQQVAPAR